MLPQFSWDKEFHVTESGEGKKERWVGLGLINKQTLTFHTQINFQAGEGKKGTDKAVFVDILTTRNNSQLRATFNTYKNVSIVCKDSFFFLWFLCKY